MTSTTTVVIVELVLACVECGKDAHVTTELTLGRPNFLGEQLCPKCLADITGEDFYLGCDEVDVCETELQQVDFTVAHLMPVPLSKNPSGWESIDTSVEPLLEGGVVALDPGPAEAFPLDGDEDDLPF